jgi:hypothetical protein
LLLASSWAFSLFLIHRYQESQCPHHKGHVIVAAGIGMKQFDAPQRLTTIKYIFANFCHTIVYFNCFLCCVIPKSQITNVCDQWWKFDFRQSPTLAKGFSPISATDAGISIGCSAVRF